MSPSLRIGRPAPDQLRQHRRAPGERALHRVLEVEQAQIILAPLADDDPLLALLRVGDDPRALGIELPLQRLGEGRHPHRPAAPARPTATPARDRPASCRSRSPPRPAACWARPPRGAARTSPPPRPPSPAAPRAARPLRRSARPAAPAHPPAGIDMVRGGGRSAASSHCGSRENSIRSPRSGLASRWPTNGAQPQPSRCSVALAVHAPSRSGQSASASRAEQRLGDRDQRRRRLGIARRRLDPDRARHPRHRRHREPRRMDEGEQFEQVEPGHIGIAQPLPDQRRVEQDVRRLRQPARSPRPATPRAPRRPPRSRCRHGLHEAREGAKERPRRSAIGDAGTKGQQLSDDSDPQCRHDEQGLAL